MQQKAAENEQSHAIAIHHNMGTDHTYESEESRIGFKWDLDIHFFFLPSSLISSRRGKTSDWVNKETGKTAHEIVIAQLATRPSFLVDGDGEHVKEESETFKSKL